MVTGLEFDVRTDALGRCPVEHEFRVGGILDREANALEKRDLVTLPSDLGVVDDFAGSRITILWGRTAWPAACSPKALSTAEIASGNVSAS
jgi:hypothetical protein